MPNTPNDQNNARTNNDPVNNVDHNSNSNNIANSTKASNLTMKLNGNILVTPSFIVWRLIPFLNIYSNTTFTQRIGDCYQSFAGKRPYSFDAMFNVAPWHSTLEFDLNTLIPSGIELGIAAGEPLVNKIKYLYASYDQQKVLEFIRMARTSPREEIIKFAKENFDLEIEFNHVVFQKLSSVMRSLKIEHFGILDWGLLLLPFALESMAWIFFCGAINILRSEKYTTGLKVLFGVTLLIPSLAAGVAFGLATAALDLAKRALAMVLTGLFTLTIITPIQLFSPKAGTKKLNLADVIAKAIPKSVANTPIASPVNVGERTQRATNNADPDNKDGNELPRIPNGNQSRIEILD